MASILTRVVLAQAEMAPVHPLRFSSTEAWLFFLIGLVIYGIILLYSAFWLWMIVHCALREPDRYFWVWLLIVVPFPGAIVYAVVRFFPQREYAVPAWLRAWTRGNELARLQTAAEQIGNAHQFIQWGDALREVGRLDQANAAYAQALAKDPKSLQALWGAAQVAVRQKRPADVEAYCRQVLAIDPQYKFGDVSLAYCRALKDQGQSAKMREQLEQHVRRWRHPEAVYLLACQCRDEGEVAVAREHLLSMLRDIHGSPTAIARKFGRWRSLGRQMLRKLPRD